MEKIVGNASYCKTEILGKGRFSTVFKGTLLNYRGCKTMPVAVKRFSKKESIEIKIKIASCHIRNPNIIDYHIIHGNKDFKFMVIEYCAGTLDDVVHGKCEGPSDSLQQITSGLTFLHSLKIVHGNLKPSNILVSFPTGNNILRMKLADFGLRSSYKGFRHDVGVLTAEWKAPESNLTPALDVYCLARIFCFILSMGLFPTDINFIDFITFINHFKDEEPFTFSWSVEAMVELINSMMSYEASKRPTASQVLQHPVFASVSVCQSQKGTGSVRVGKHANDDDLIVLPPLPKKVFEIIDLDSSGEEEETAATAKQTLGSTALVDNLLSKMERDFSNHALPCSNLSEPTPSNEEIPTPRAASKRTQIMQTSQVSPPPPKKINVDPIDLRLQGEVVQNSDSEWQLSASDEKQRPQQSSEPTQEDGPPAVSNDAVGRKRGRVSCCKEEDELLRLCGQEGLNDEEMVRLLQLLTDKNININCCSKFTCNTPLMLICSSKSDYLIGLVKAFLQREDVDLSLTNRLGHTALTLLCRQSQNSSLIECVRLLVDHGMDVTVKDCYSRCALHLLCQYYKGGDLIKIARMLIREDMNVKELVNCVEILRGRKLQSEADLIDGLIHSICLNEAEVTHPQNQPPANPFQSEEEAGVCLPLSNAFTN